MNWVSPTKEQTSDFLVEEPKVLEPEEIEVVMPEVVPLPILETKATQTFAQVDPGKQLTWRIMNMVALFTNESWEAVLT